MNREDMEFELSEQWSDNIWHFVNALLLAYFSENECSDIIVEHQLLMHSVDQFDRRKNATVTKWNIPSRFKFVDVLRENGVPTEYLDQELSVDYVTVLSILERADALERYPDHVKMMDDAIVEWKKYGDDVL